MPYCHDCGAESPTLCACASKKAEPRVIKAGDVMWAARLGGNGVEVGCVVVRRVIKTVRPGRFPVYEVSERVPVLSYALRVGADRLWPTKREALEELARLCRENQAQAARDLASVERAIGTLP